jgi:hypothetical protein
MVSFAVLTNVAVLNYCYDVPVKLYSTNLTLMALFLVIPDARRLFEVLVRNRAAAPADLNPVRFERRWLRIASVVCWVVVVGIHFVGGIWSGWNGYRASYVERKHPAYYGIYDVVSGGPEWSKVVVNYEGGIVVRRRDDTIQRFPTKDAKWSTPDADSVLLEGVVNGAPAAVRLQRVDPAKYPQTTRGFHWISEYPFNR